MAVKILRMAHVAPTPTPSTDLNSARCSAHSARVRDGRSNARFTHLSYGTKALGKGTWACSGVDLTSVKEVERMSLRRVPSWSATTISSETYWPVGRSIWNTRYGCLSPTARAMRGLGRVSVRFGGRSRGPARARVRKVAGRRRSGKRAGMRAGAHVRASRPRVAASSAPAVRSRGGRIP